MGAPAAGFSAAGNNPMGFNPFAGKPAKDPFKSKLLELTARYKPLCGDVPEGHRFRVRGEILSDREDYFTVEFHCVMPGVINLPWAEYSSAELLIRHGPALELAEQVQKAVRRCPDRMGREITVSQAANLRVSRPDVWKRLTMSSKDYKSLPKEERTSRQGDPDERVPLPRPRGEGHYERRAEEARQVMDREVRNRASAVRPAEASPDRLSWSDEVDEEIPLPSRPVRAPAPFTEQRAGPSSQAEDRQGNLGGSNRGSSSVGRKLVPPAPTTRGSPPAATGTSVGTGERKVPLSTTGT
jgi:hypothetical protein